MELLSEYISGNYKKVIGWGTSLNYQINSQKLPNIFDYLIDNNEKKHGLILDNRIIHKPDQLKNENPEDTLIVIFSEYYDDICKTINKYGAYYTINAEELVEFSRLIEVGNDTSILKSDNIVYTISRNNYTWNINGLSKFLAEQIDSLTEVGYSCLHIFWRKYNIKQYHQNIYFIVAKEGKEITFIPANQFLENVDNVKTILIHSIAGLDKETLNKLAAKVGEIPILYFLHDFSCICKNIKLMYNNDVFCASYENNWEKCLTCDTKVYRNEIYNYHKTFFVKENVKLISPSVSTKTIVEKAFNLEKNKVQVVPHQKYQVSNKKDMDQNDVLKIAYVGYKHKHKGWDTFKELVSDYKDKYKFYCFGFSDEIIDDVEFVEVSFLKNDENTMTNKLIEYNIDIAFLWSVWPETYSYTYYESFAAGAFVITNILSGNINDQIQINRNGISLKSYDDLKALLSNEHKLKNLMITNSKFIQGLSENKDFLQLIN